MRYDAEKLILKIRLAKALNEDWNYKQFAEAINIEPASLYNFMNRQYNLSYEKARELESLLSDLID